MTQPRSSDPSPAFSAPVTPSPSGGGFPLWAKLLLGCGVFLLVLAIVVVGVAVWGFHRLTRPGREVAAQRVITDRSVGWVRVESVADDPGLHELAENLFFELQRLGQRQQGRDMPEWIRRWRELSQAQQRNNPALGWLLPRETTFAFESEAGEDHVAAVFNLGLIARVIGWVRGLGDEQPGSKVRKVRGHDVTVEPAPVMAFLDGTLLVTDDLETMERLIDRIESETVAAEAPEAAEIAALAEGDWDFYGRLDNRSGDFEKELLETGKVLGADPVKVPLSVETVSFRANVVTADRLEAELTIDTVDEAAAEMWLDVLERQRERLEAEDLQLDLDQRTDGRQVRAVWRISGLEAWLTGKLETWLDEVQREAERQAAEAHRQGSVEGSEDADGETLEDLPDDLPAEAPPRRQQPPG